jgi:hypothetical protein
MSNGQMEKGITMNYTIADVLRHFYPNSQYRLVDSNDYSTLEWNSTEIEKPTRAHLNSLKLELDYIVARQMLYPTIPEQLDMLWHDIDQNPELQLMFPKFYNGIKTIKDSVPKSLIEPVIIDYPKDES